MVDMKGVFVSQSASGLEEARSFSNRRHDELVYEKEPCKKAI